jgi:hypothetical protein
MPPTTRAAYEKKIKTLRGGLHELFNNVEIKLTLRSRSARGPGLKLAPSVNGISTVTLFTATTKMVCPSFSLPAGPIKLGGACPAAGVASLVRDPKLFICHSCYAIGGKYGVPRGNVATAQAARLVWAMRAVADGTLGEQLHHALYAYHQAPRHNRDGRLMDPLFFRIHDAGDCFSPAYYAAWVHLAREAPRIKFWMPTRNWALGDKWVDLMDVLKRPKNLIVRPSALHFGDLPPDISGLDAGTTSSVKKMPRVLDCPAYATKTGNCEDARCRVCWTQPGRQVSYHPHGSAPKTNPPGYKGGRGLYALWQQYKDTDGGDVSVFESWLYKVRADPNNYTEKEWTELYKKLGANNDEIATYLEEGAEWQS